MPNEMRLPCPPPSFSRRACPRENGAGIYPQHSGPSSPRKQSTTPALPYQVVSPGRALVLGSTSVLVCACDKHSPADGSSPLTRPCPGRGQTPSCHPVTRCPASDRTSGTPGVPFLGPVCHRTDRDGTEWHRMAHFRRTEAALGARARAIASKSYAPGPKRNSNASALQTDQSPVCRAPVYS